MHVLRKFIFIGWFRQKTKQKKNNNFKLISPFSYTVKVHTRTCLQAYADSEGQDKPAHPRSLIRAFTVR